MTSGFDILKADVIDEGLCTRCGSCIGVCPKDALILDDILGKCLPKQVADCGDCSAPCIVSCPGKYVDFPELDKFVFGRNNTDYILGQTADHYICHSTDENIRKKGASGGAITGINKYLLESGYVDGILTLIVEDDEPLIPKPVIATSWDVLSKAQQSKYCIAPVNTVLKELEKFNGMVAYVGLPCQIHSIRKLQKENHSSVKNIKLVIGSYCGGLLHFSAIGDLFNKLNIKDKDEIKKLEYRADEWPGKTKITLKNNKVFELEKFYANYMNLFYPVSRCLTCTDLTSEFADISAGDAWAPEYEKRGRGYSLIISRTKRGVEALDLCIGGGALKVIPISRNKAITMHSHGLDNKKNGGFLRIGHLKFFGRSVPEYGYEPLSISLTRKIVGFIISAAFYIGRTWWAKRIVLMFPLKLTGMLFKGARTLWKNFTKPERKKGILSFQTKTYPVKDLMLEKLKEIQEMDEKV